MDDVMFRLAHDLRSRVEGDVDVEAALRDLEVRMLAPAPTETEAASDLRPRWTWMLAAAAAVLAVVVAGAVFLTGNDATVRTTEPGTTAPPAPTTVVATAPASTAPATVPATAPEATPETTLPSTSAPPATTTAPSVSPATIGVSYREPPPELAYTPFVSFAYTSPDEASAPLAFGELGVVFNVRGSITAIGWDGARRDIPLTGELDLYSLVYGPGDVVYGLDVDESGGTTLEIRLVAVPLSGAAAGTVIAESEDLGLVGFVELPTVALGHGPDGIVALVREPGRTLLGYVDETGQPRGWEAAPAEIALIDQGELVTTPTAAWQLAIERDPDWSGDLAGPGGVAPSSAGNFVYPTTIGGPLDPDADYPEHGTPVIAVLGGQWGTWWSIPDGWQFESSSPDGVLLSRLDADTLTRQLALFQPPPPTTPIDSLPSQDSGIGRTCDEGEMCTQLAVDRGTLITYEPTTGIITRHSDPPVSAEIAFEFLGWDAGPDGAIYFTVQSPGTVDPVGDVVAVSLAAGDAGREIERWPGVADLTGDSVVVATRGGWVRVGCCGPDTVRPDPDAPVEVEWVGPDAEAAGAIDVLQWDVDGRVLGDDAEWAVDTGGDQWHFGFRGMPWIVTTDDGGFIAALPDVSWGVIRLARGYPDGTVRTVDVSEYPALLEPSATVLYPDGDTFRRVMPFAASTS